MTNGTVLKLVIKTDNVYKKMLNDSLIRLVQWTEWGNELVPQSDRYV